jgi:uncharacterized protein YecE (DUF72 family)
MTKPFQRPIQQGLFGPLEHSAPSRDRVLPPEYPSRLRELGRMLPPSLRLGTSSWNFPGWRGLVYASDAPAKLLSSEGLQAYGQHPLLRTVGLDRTFYAPISAAEHASYAALVPQEFRFLVKAWGELLGFGAQQRGAAMRGMLDPDALLRHCIAPAVEGLGEKLGVLLLQFPPQGAAVVRAPDHFAGRLHECLLKLPQGISYAVELRDAALLTSNYAAVLQDAGAWHCYAVHPSQPSLARQLELVPVRGQVFVRWLLREGLQYQEAMNRYNPFDKIVDIDLTTRAIIVDLACKTMQNAVPMLVVINNKAEGCAPASVEALARSVMGQYLEGRDPESSVDRGERV